MVFEHGRVLVVGPDPARSHRLASNSRAFMMMKQTFSGEIVSGPASVSAATSVGFDFSAMGITRVMKAALRSSA